MVTDGLVLCLDAANTKGYDKFENLMTNSQLGTTILNDGGGVTLTTDTTITNPFGVNDGVLKCVHTTNTPGYFRRGQNRSLTAGVTYTFSFYFKNGTVSNPYGQNRLSIGTLTSTYTPTFQELGQSLNTNIPVGNGWYRQVFTFTPSYTQTYQVDFNQMVSQTPIGTYYLYGFQLEIGSSVTDYYATTSTAKTRGTTWTDLSIGGGNNGTLTNGPTYSSSNRGSVVFDGVNDYVDCGSITTGGKITVNAWIKMSTGSTFQHIVDSSSNSWHLAILNNNRPYFYNGSVYHTAAQVLSSSTWYMLTGVQSSTLDIYVNGVLSQSLSSNLNVTTNNVNIGRYQSASRPFSGNIAQVSIYNKALTAAEIQQNFNAQRGRFGI